MRRAIVVSVIVVFVMLAACAEKEIQAPADDLPEADLTPQYGGSLNIGTVVVTLAALSWDPADWSWKINHDTGGIR